MSMDVTDDIYRHDLLHIPEITKREKRPLVWRRFSRFGSCEEAEWEIDLVTLAALAAFLGSLERR